MMQVCGSICTAPAEPICPCPAGALGGLDARLGASLNSPEDVSPRFFVRSRRSGRAPQYGAPPNRAGVRRSSRLDAGGSADADSAAGHMACGASSVTPTEL